MKKCIKAVVKGRVQGVGFRWFIQQKANRLGLAGYVCNLASGNVEFEVEGDEDLVDKFLDYARQGPSFSKVTEMILEEKQAAGKFDSFNVTF